MNLQSLPQTIGLEHRDRVARFERLAQAYGVTPPQIDQMQVSKDQVPGITYPVPVVRVVFDSKVLFDFDKDTLRPEAMPIVDLIAQNMHHDVPDANLLILGHTDAVGSDAYNIDLSARRAATVMQALIARGVSPSQLATVPIGKRQPIAPNSTEDGRARNRRVEFMISASQAANLQLVERRVIVREYLQVGSEEPAVPPTPQVVQVLRPVVEPQLASLPPDGAKKPPETVTSQAPESVQSKPVDGPKIHLQPAGEVHLQVPESEVHLQTLQSATVKSLNDQFVM